MTVRSVDGMIILSGDCPVEDAETLLGMLGDPLTRVDVEGCGRIHTAVVQILLAARPRVQGKPANPFFRDRVLPQLLDAPG
jgi:hypothetical protein